MKNQHAWENIQTMTSNTATYVGSGTAIAGGLTLNEWGVIIGVLLGVAGYLTNLWFLRLRNLRERELHAKELGEK